MKEWVKEYYNENPDFHRYVEEFRRAKHISMEEALELKVVENVALSYENKLKVGDN